MLNVFDHFESSYKLSYYNAFKTNLLECNNDFGILNGITYFFDVSFDKNNKASNFLTN